jgi:hypothetical protein
MTAVSCDQWSTRLGRCMSAVEKPLACLGGLCGKVSSIITAGLWGGGFYVVGHPPRGGGISPDAIKGTVAPV